LEQNHLSKLRFNHPKIFLGTLDFDDVGAYFIDNDQLLVQSVDVIASIPVSPYDFGAICAAHCLSDLYSKSVTPITALNILFHSASPYYPEQINGILSGLAEKLLEANTALIGGHTINEKLLYCGLIISGIIHKKDIVLMKGAKEGDDLVLTKPLGTGIISLVVRNKILEKFPQKAISTMSALNNVLLNLKDKHLVHSSTDVTGAGLAGSLYNIAVKNSVQIEVQAAEIPFYEEAWVNALNEENGALFNQDYAGELINIDNGISKEIRNLLFDPQTSGGLLLALPPHNTNQILDEIYYHNRSIEPKVIGKITRHGTPEIIIR
jgi:selenide,water dikinase